MVVRNDMAESRAGQKELRGTHAGLIVFAGIATANLGNYLFHLISARYLGPRPYGDVAALVAFAGLVSLPLGGIQVAVAREVARLAARGQGDVVAGLLRRSLVAAGTVALSFTLVLVALSALLRTGLQIDSLTAVVLTALLTAPAMLTPIVWGAAQGLERFSLLSSAIALGPAVRVVALLALLAAGLGVVGAMAASLVAAAVAFAAPLLFLRGTVFGAARKAAAFPYRRAVARVGPVVLGILAITSLTTLDVVVTKAAFSGHEAGIYGGASLIGRVILYLPMAVVTVLLPKVTARSARREESANLLTASLLVTGGFCFVATACYVLLPELIVRVALGGAFDDAAPLLWMFGLAMSGYSLLNVLLFYHLGRGHSTMSWLLFGGAVAQAAAFLLLHDSPRQLLTVSIVTAAALLVAHEIALDRSATRIVTSGFRVARDRLAG